MHGLGLAGDDRNRAVSASHKYSARAAEGRAERADFSAAGRGRATVTSAPRARPLSAAARAAKPAQANLVAAVVSSPRTRRCVASAARRRHSSPIQSPCRPAARLGSRPAPACSQRCRGAPRPRSRPDWRRSVELRPHRPASTARRPKIRPSRPCAYRPAPPATHPRTTRSCLRATDRLAGSTFSLRAELVSPRPREPRQAATSAARPPHHSAATHCSERSRLRCSARGSTPSRRPSDRIRRGRRRLRRVRATSTKFSCSAPALLRDV